jgi:hypothetical protein
MWQAAAGSVLFQSKNLTRSREVLKAYKNDFGIISW